MTASLRDAIESGFGCTCAYHGNGLISHAPNCPATSPSAEDRVERAVHEWLQGQRQVIHDALVEYDEREIKPHEDFWPIRFETLVDLVLGALTDPPRDDQPAAGAP